MIDRSRFVNTVSNMSTAGARLELRPGIITLTPDPKLSPGPYSWQVSCGGNVVQAAWAKGVSPYHQAPCTLALATVNNVTTYTVIAVMSAQPNLSGMYQVTAFTGGAGSVTVKKNGNSYTAHRASSYTPTVGDFCLCFDYEGQLYAGFPLAAYSQPTPLTVPPVAPPPAPSPFGNSLIPAQDSGTWTTILGGWNTYYEQDVATGSGNIPASTASWFYNGGTLGLANRTITALQMWVPARLVTSQANNSSGVTISIWTHNALSRGTTEPSRIDGPSSFTVYPGWAGGWVPLPLSFAATIQAGGGLSIAGDPYIVLAGVGRSGDSGALLADWSIP
jgi:hypothetical protein